MTGLCETSCLQLQARVNALASKNWGSNDYRMTKTPDCDRESGHQSEAPKYSELMSQKEKKSGLSLVVIVHNIAAGCTPRFLRNFQHAWKIPKQRGVKVIWPAAACLMGDPDNHKIEHLIVGHSLARLRFACILAAAFGS